MVDGLAGLRGAAAARRYGDALRTANRERMFGVRDRARGDHADRHDLIMRGVGRIAAAGESVEVNIAGLLRLEPPFERFFERGQ